MYIPRGWHFAAPVGAVLLTFGINQQVLGGGWHWDFALLVQLPVSAIAYKTACFIHEAGVVWQKWEANEPITPKPQPVIPLNVDGVTHGLVYTQVTEPPRLDNERKFARTLIAMRNGNLKVDLTEAYWVEDGNRYGEERDKFAAMKKRWERNGVVGRAGNGYVVTDWRKVRLVADGHPLPLQ